MMCLVVAAAHAGSRALDMSGLRQGFADPPAPARPQAIWFWFKNDVTKEEVSRELEEMVSMGLGGAEIRIIDDLRASDPAHVPRRRAPYLSDAWFEVLEHVLREAQRLGLAISVNPGMGWRYGGPWIPLEHQSAKLKVNYRWVRGPTWLRGRLDILRGVPTWNPADVLLFAWRTNRESRSPAVIHDSFLDLGDHLKPVANKYDIDWRVPEGEWLLAAFVSHRIGSPDHVAPDSAGAGRSFDPFSKEAVRLHLGEVGNKLKERVGDYFGSTLTELATDSWEYDEVGVDWSPEIVSAFPDKMGYDLRPYLHVLADHGPDETRVRRDVEAVKSELLLEAFFGEITGWCERNGLLHRSQPYGEPKKDLFAAYRASHVPDVERLEPLEAPWVAHACGKPLVTAEAFTGMPGATARNLAEQANLFYMIGVNRLDLHSFAYSPAEAGNPGWQMYVPIHINRHSSFEPFQALVVRLDGAESMVVAGGKAGRKRGCGRDRARARFLLLGSAGELRPRLSDKRRDRGSLSFRHRRCLGQVSNGRWRPNGPRRARKGSHGSQRPRTRGVAGDLVRADAG